MLVYVCVYRCERLYDYVIVCVCLRLFAPSCERSCVLVLSSVCLCMCVIACVCLYMFVYVCVYLRVLVYSCVC